MRCFGRAFAFEACVLRPLDLMALRAELLPAPPRPVHFFFTAGCAAGRDGAFCLAICALPFFVDEKRLAQNWKFADFVGWAKAGLRRAHLHSLRCKTGGHASLCPPYGPIAPQLARAKADQCSWKTPFTARSSAGLISRECATVTENSGPSSFSCQNARKSCSAGNFGNRS